MQVEVHNVEAHIAGAHHAQERVHIGAVVVEQAAAFVHQGCDFLDIALEEAQGVGVGHHNAGDVGAEQRLEVLHVHESVGAGLHHHDVQAADGSAGGVGAVGAVGHDNLGTGSVAAAEMVLPHQHKACQFTVGSCAGQEGEVLHTCNLGKGLVHKVQHFPGSLHSRFGLEGVQGVERRDDFLVDLGIVFHRAGTQRIEAGIHAEVHLAEVGVVAHHVHLADLGKVEGTLPP